MQRPAKPFTPVRFRLQPPMFCKNKVIINEFKEMTKNINEVNLSKIEHGNFYLNIEQDTVSNYRLRWEPQDYE